MKKRLWNIGVVLLISFQVALAPPLLTGNRSEMRKLENAMRIKTAEYMIATTYSQDLKKVDDFQTLEDMLDMLDNAKDVLDRVWFGRMNPLEPELIKKIEDLRLRIRARFDMVVARIEELGNERSEVRKAA